MFKRPPKRILTWSTPGFGDVLIATPLVRSMRQAWPDARIDMIVHEGREAMLVGNPDIHRAIAIPKRTNPWQLLGLLARTIGRYDLAAHGTGSDRAMVVMRLAARRCVAVLGARNRNEMVRRWAATRWTPRIHGESQLLRDLRLADLIGIDRSYEVVPPEAPDAAQRLDEVLPFGWRETPYVVFHPASHAPRKRWTVEGWHTLGRRLVRRGWRCLITGGPNEDRAYLESIRAGIDPDALVLAGQLEITDVRELIERSRLYVGVDTATTHLAAALGIPTVGIFGPGTTNRFVPWPRDYASGEPPFQDVQGVAMNQNVCLIQAECPCGHDYRNKCGTELPGRSRCLEELAPQVVVNATEQLLERAKK
ncbi:MAG: glycosyltransferase family 9 protein [Planctomycetota bacterium]|jgi:heptosyltransferase-3